MRVMQLKFGGAEPFLRPDLAELLRVTREERMRFLMITNGSLVTPEKAAAIAALHRCDAIQVSLDGPRACHDAARGDGAFDGAVRGIALLREAGLPVWVRITVGRHNLGRLRETLELAVDQLGVERVSTNAIMAVTSSTRDLRPLALSALELAESIREHLALLPRYGSRLARNRGPLSKFAQWSDLERCRRENRPPRPRCACRAIFQSLAVRADGAYLACSQYPELELGRVGRDSLADVWNGAPLRQLREAVCRDLSAAHPACDTCPYHPWCSAKCPAVDRAENLCYREFQNAGGGEMSL